MQYLSKYVQVSNYRKQLYHRIFIKYIPEIKLDDFGEINLPDWRAQNPQNPVERYSTAPPEDGFTLINQGIPPPSTSDDSLSISELYMNKRFIPFDQLKTALTTTILCPSASAEMIEDVLELLLLSNFRGGGEADPIEKSHDIFDSGPKREGGTANGIINIPLSTTESVSGKDLLQVKRKHDGNLNSFIATDDERRRERKIVNDGPMTGDVNRESGQTQRSFAETASRVVADLQPNASPQSGISDVVIAAQKAAAEDGGMATGPSSRHREQPLEEIVANGVDEFLSEEIKINFRTWCGIVAFAERYTTNILKEKDTRHEVRGS